MTAARVKQEDVDLNASHLSGTIAPQQPPQRAVSIRSASASSFEHHLASGNSSLPSTMDHEPEEEPQLSSTIADDTEMTDLHGDHDAPVTAHSSDNVSPDPLHTMSQRARQHIKVIQKLDALGINSTLQSLPSFVVVGDQSAGKSSIIESVCDISLPRNEGTCTRCPFQITTTAGSAGTPWSCKVSLHYKFAYHPHGNPGVGDFDFWTPSEFWPLHYRTVYEKSKLNEVLRNAQTALLCPGQDPSVYPPTGPEEIRFSPNVVSLEIEAPDLPELTLYDLPGAINRHEIDEEQYLVPFIEKLMKSYLQDDKALVLLACSANTDVHNSTAFRFVDECNATKRCMGVLTKPDLLRDSFASILRMLKRETFRVGAGWYVTKQLSQGELEKRVTHVEARQKEEAFFQQQPWTGQKFAAFRDRFGIINVRQTMSSKLISHIVGEIPALVARVEARHAEVTGELSSFPVQAVSASFTVHGVVQDIVNAMASHMSGNITGGGFRQEYRQLLQATRAKLVSLRPHVDLGTPGFVVEVDSSEDGPPPTPTPKRGKGNNGQPIRTPQGGQGRSGGTPRSSVKRENPQPTASRRVFKLDEVKEQYDASTATNLESEVDPKVTSDLILQTLKGWPVVTEDLLAQLDKGLLETMQTTIGKLLSTRKKTRLFAEVYTTVKSFATGLLRSQAAVIAHLVECEQYKPTTRNAAYGDMITTAQTKLHRDRLTKRVDEYYDTLDSKTNKVTSRQERMKKVDDIGAKMTRDEYEREVRELARPLAYYDIASARLLDYIALHLERDLLYQLETGLAEKLFTALRVTDEAYCATLLAEDPAREAHRKALLAEKGKLEAALAELAGLKENVVTGP